MSTILENLDYCHRQILMVVRSLEDMSSPFSGALAEQPARRVARRCSYLQFMVDTESYYKELAHYCRQHKAPWSAHQIVRAMETRHNEIRNDIRQLIDQIIAECVSTQVIDVSRFHAAAADIAERFQDHVENENRLLYPVLSLIHKHEILVESDKTHSHSEPTGESLQPHLLQGLASTNFPINNGSPRTFH